MSSWSENLIVVLVGIAAVAYIGKHTSILLVKLKFKSDLYKGGFKLVALRT